MFKPTSPLTVAVAFALWGAAANADQLTDQIAQRYQELGFDYIEIKEGIDQVKVEAIQGDRKMEVIYDRATGKILKQETERASAAEMRRRGVEIDSENENFVDRNEIDDDSSDESDDDENDESDESDEDSDESDDNDESDDDSDESDDDSDESGDDSSESDESDDED